MDPALGSSRPRDVQLTPGGRAVLVIGTLLLIAAVGAAAVMFRIAVRQAADARAFAADPGFAMADVIRLWRGSDNHKESWVAYRYMVDGRPFDGRARIGLTTWNGLRVGSAMPVEYLRSEPGRSFAPDNPPKVIPIWLPFVVGGALAVFGGLFHALIVVQRRLLMNGRLAPAVVTGQKKHYSSHGGTHRSITYTFPLLSGGSARGRSGSPGKFPAIGSTIFVLYDPDRPRVSMPYPLSLVRPARG